MGGNDDIVKVQKTEVEKYLEYLERQKQIFIDNAEDLGSFLAGLDWKDAVFYETVNGINKHFETMNTLLSGIEDATDNLKKFLSELEGYFNSVKHLS